MTDRRRSENHKQVSGYIPLELALEFKSICARLGISQGDAVEEMIQEWLDKTTGVGANNTPKEALTTIADLVRLNMSKLQRCGIKNLQALAEGEVLPTPADFAIITSLLGISEQERIKIWQGTYKPSVYQHPQGVKVYRVSEGVKADECEYSESP
ncbi:hypothetical protein NIES2100_78150 [Calothrix sp. NIES-2100]|uniref:hypothetical protein n=1 Tax=Calothrix sp. NIES-2100 TaxID=1954172 RepID=UPI000B618639|nr:hypothetical protein NIES2100_78150 [Calothrix sp. NIES-2100]